MLRRFDNNGIAHCITGKETMLITLFVEDLFPGK